MQVEEYEKEILRRLNNDTLSNALLHKVLNHPEKVECNFTGAGYFLDIHHNELPSERMVLSTPVVSAMYQEMEIGFLAFIENHVLSLECYNHEGDHKGVPPGVRYGNVQLATT